MVYNICMLNKSGNNRWYVANKIFTDNFIVASLIEFSIMITALVDGLVVSRLLAPGSMASFGLARPYFSIIAIFFGFMTTGMQTLCSEKIGRGDAKNFNRIFFSAIFGTSDYIRGLSIGLPATMLNAILLPAIQMDSGKLVIRMQDNCPRYDAGKRLKALENAGQKEKMSNLGSWLTQNFTDDVRYIYSFECNIIIMEFKITKN